MTLIMRAGAVHRGVELLHKSADFFYRLIYNWGGADIASPQLFFVENILRLKYFIINFKTNI
jgi:hypothetical protein